jgi:type VI secretion system protein ImpA
MIDDPHRGVCFPNQLRTLPLLGHDSHTASYTDWIRLRGSTSNSDADRLSTIREQAPPQYFQTTLATLDGCSAQLNQLRELLEQRLGDDAPGLLNLRDAIDELRGLVADELSMLGVEPSPSGAESVITQATTESFLGNVADLRECNREELYTLLDQTAERLRGMEPHSPIPYLVKRAVRLGRLPFPALMKQVIREEATLSELNREFGLAEPNGIASLA